MDTFAYSFVKISFFYSPICSSLIEDSGFTRQDATMFYRRAKLSWRNLLLPSYAMKKKAEASSSFPKTIRIHNTADPSLRIHHCDNTQNSQIAISLQFAFSHNKTQSHFFSYHNDARSNKYQVTKLILFLN